MEKNQTPATAPETKKKRSFADSWLALILGTFAIILVGEMVGIPAAVLPAIAGMIPAIDTGAMNTFAMYIAFIGIWAAVVFWFLIIPKNRPMNALYLPKKLKGNNLPGLLIGLLLGFLQNGACILAAYLNHDIELKFNHVNLIYLIPIFIAVFIQSSAEEIVCRGFLYYRLEKSYQKPWLAIIISASFFGALHLTNPGVTVLSVISIIAVGVQYSLIVYYTDSMWCVFAAHASWNFTQNIVFGLPNSGQLSEYSIFTLNADTAKDSLFYNVGFGVEGTLFADILLIVCCIVIFLLRNKLRCKEKTDIWTLQPTKK